MSAVLIMLSLMPTRLCIFRKNSGTKRSVRGVFVFCCSQYCQDCLSNCEIWIAFFALSCFSTSMPVVGANKVQDFRIQTLMELQMWLGQVGPQLQGCDATLYSPHTECIVEACTYMAMQCFLFELEIAMFEKNIKDVNRFIQSQKNETLLLKSSCPPCEGYEETNIMTFLERFRNLLRRMVSDVKSKTNRP